MAYYHQKEFDNVLELFGVRTREVRARIQILQKDLDAVKHHTSKAIVLNELHNTTDDYVERKFILERA